MLKIHILFNYYPAIGMVIGTLLLAAGLLFRKTRWKRFSLKLFVFLAILTFFVALAGEVASWAAGGNVGPQAAALTAHKHFATLAFAVTAITGIVALTGLLRSSTDSDRGTFFYATVLALATISSILLINAIFRGRQVKWAGTIPVASSKVLIDMENKLWHA